MAPLIASPRIPYSFLLFLGYLLFSQATRAQNISTSTTVPPLQWINLSNLVQGSTKPPPLRDASLGYDETSRSLIVFGGLSESGVAQSQTFLLNLQTLTWSLPSPPSNLQRAPPARSGAISGVDFAASNRHGFVVIGGKGANNEALSDVWEFDFINQFWSPVVLSPGGPSARWGASGGIDFRTPFVSDPIVPGPNNTLYLAGGFNGQNPDPLSDVWSLSLSGTLSSNLPDAVSGSWTKLSIQSLPGRVEQAGTVVQKEIVAVGGCDSTTSLSATNSSCAKQDSFIINAGSQTTVTPAICLAPRIAPVLVPNVNTFSTAFISQVFVMLGAFNTSLWQDSDGLAKGEVAILDVDTGTWTRTIPSGDPSSSAQFPSPRQGSSAISFSQALVGTSRTVASDTIVFGGQDSNGAFSSDLWLLRAYTGALTASSPTFKSGQLQSGINADGSGVRLTLLTECASMLSPTNTSPPSTTTAQGGGASTTTDKSPASTDPNATSVHFNLYNTSFTHKLLLPLSILLFTPGFLILRWTQTSVPTHWIPTEHVSLVSLATVLAFASYGLGLAGFVLAFTTISSASSSTKSVHLQTGHGIAGLVFFILLFFLVPIFLIYSRLDLESRLSRMSERERTSEDAGNSTLAATNEKAESIPMRPQSSSHTPSLTNPTPPMSPTPRPRAMSWDASMTLRRSSHEHDGAVDNENESAPSSSPTPHKGFEVLNRGNGRRPRKLSGPWEVSSVPGARGGRVPSTRRLGEIDWLLRRRSLNVVGELDYAITQAHNANYLAAANGQSRSVEGLRMPIDYPPTRTILLHLLLQISILGLCAVTLAALFQRARRYLFALFLIWTLAFYATMFVLSWNGRPASSLLTATLFRLRGQDIPLTPEDSDDIQTSNTLRNSIPEPGPYAHHRPPFRASAQLDEIPLAQASPGSDDNDDDDIDEDTRQRLIEEEMERRDVSIVTVPRRKLYLTNPS
ncbi:hypothetical protein BDN70DRAFT_882353 [Pholiota conissans]|uniref:Uncharacterized protein n=1 Tax=Pholiota conissans TaxID=109636 RepID=A0A9P5YWK3_9AGAR|nr:hypothetical protein BDN70DRAFT_882353 [Pholiota conissans]